MVYDIEPFRAAVRKGEWKLVWQVTLPRRVELFNLAEDPAEKTNLADKEPQRVADLQQRIEALADEAVPPLILSEALVTVTRVLFGSVVLPRRGEGAREATVTGRVPRRMRLSAARRGRLASPGGRANRGEPRTKVSVSYAAQEAGSAPRLAPGDET